MVRPKVAEATAAGADTFVLACTHFSFLGPVLSQLAGPDVKVIDPAPAVATQTARVAVATDGAGVTSFAVSGDPGEFRHLAASLAGFTTEHIMSFP
jgi:glutamate racemase